ncbi:transcriptional regulator, TetR family [Sphingomonas jatrophae]|uniref:Transcriptional regulator, TetR family n=2 Tax=Sphingomonas jatrophae TaxID=1166337 RepID=A0A1I6JA75_9SPHN|nr:TetR/AcrR family transcriptional regulator [Sphingomonas jatrophae]SFR75883.1 transcriptional regulator, TetR family [Sphingomonas jatrophae]
MGSTTSGAQARTGPGPRRNAEQRRTRIVAAARSLFAQQGFHGTGVAQIARESDVLVGQIYRDFAGKEDLIAAIVEQDIAELLDDPNLTEAIATGDSRRLRDWISGFITRQPDEEGRRLFADIAADALRNTRTAAILAAAQTRLRDSLRLALTMLAPGEQSAAARDTLAELIFTVGGAMLHRQICFTGEGHDALARKFIQFIDDELDRLEADSARSTG